MKEKKKYKKTSALHLAVFLLMTAFFLLPGAGKEQVYGLEFETDEDNNIEFKIEHTAASSTAAYKYSTGAWYLRVNDKELGENNNTWNGATQPLTREQYENPDTLAVGGEAYKTVPAIITPGKKFTSYYKLDGEELVAWLSRSEENIKKLHSGVSKSGGKITRKVVFIANKLTYAYEVAEYNRTGNDQQYGPFYNLDDFYAHPQKVWGCQWGGNKKDYSKFYGQSCYITLRAAAFSIEVQDTSTKKSPAGYNKKNSNEFPYSEVFYQENIPAIAASEIDGYKYVGYQWMSNGKVIKQGTGTVTEPLSGNETSSKKIGKSLTLTFLYQPLAEVTVPPTSIPIPATPTPSAPTPTPSGSITVTFDPDGGLVSPETKSVVYGQPYGQLPTPTKEGYQFYGWFYAPTDSNPNIGKYPLVTSRDDVLVNADHTLIAVYLEDKEPEGPTATPTPEPTPIEDREQYSIRNQFFTTDKGYTLDAIANDSGNPIAGATKSTMDASYSSGGRLPSAASTKRSYSYTVGTDAAGNSWYFRRSSTDATLVHPKSYKINGTVYDADTEEVKYITELTFPSELTYNGTTYKVVSIGGGGATYHETTSKEKQDGDASYYYQPEYGYYNYSYSDSSGMAFVGKGVHYSYGVLGNGYITSDADTWREGSSGNQMSEFAESNYYVYNTTLTKVTIPQGVEISRGAFLYCQALKEITIGGATIIGEDSFRVATILKSEISPEVTSYYDANGVKILENIRYTYNKSYSTTEKTQVMLDWETWSRLAPKAEFSEFTSVEIIKEHAFSFRDNIHDITFGKHLATVERSAFYKSKLDSLTFQGTSAVIDMESYENLGTRGVDHPTIIYCEGAATQVIRYGMKQYNYYKLVCGYNVTYSPNGGKQSATGKETDYVTKTQIKSVLPEIVNAGKYALDVNGHVWFFEEGMLQRLDDLTGYHIVNFKEDATNTYFGNGYRLYWFETSDGKVYAARMKISYQKVDCTDVVYVFDTTRYKESGLKYEYGGSTAKVDTGYSTKRYRTYSVSYDSSKKILKVSSSDSNRDPFDSSSSSSVSSYVTSDSGITVNQSNYYMPDITVSFAGSKATFDVPGTKGILHTLAGRTYAEAELLGTWYGKDRESVSAPDGNSEYLRKYTHRIYALREAEGIRSLVDIVTARIENPTEEWTSSQKGTSIDLPTTIDKLHLYSRSLSMKNLYNNDVFSSRMDYIGKGADGIWYQITIQEESEQDSKYQSGVIIDLITYQLKLSYATTSVPAGFPGIDTVIADGRTITVLDTDGVVWQGTSLPGLKKAALSEKIVQAQKIDSWYFFIGESGSLYATDISLSGLADGAGVFQSDSCNLDYVDKDLIVVGNALYELSTQTFLVSLGTTYEIYDEMIVTNGKLYRRSDGLAMLEAAPDFCYEVGLSSEVFLNNGTLYRKDDFEEVPGVSDGYKFVFVAESGALMEHYGYTFRFWNTEADGTGTTYYPGNKCDAKDHIRVYAQWKENYNIVRFEPGAEDAVGNMEDLLLPIHQTTTILPANEFKRPGYSFAGWGITENGDVLFEDEASVGNVNGMVILYAQWKKNNTSYRINYMKYPYGMMGNMVWKSKILTYTAEETVEGAPYKLTGYNVEYRINTNPSMSTAATAKLDALTEENTTTHVPDFDKWKWYESAKEEPGGYAYMGESFRKGEIIFGLTEKNNDVLYFYPEWKEDNARVLLPSGRCNGYVLAGWSENANGYGTVYFPTRDDSEECSMFTPVKNTVFYAVWKPQEYEITLIQTMDGQEPEVPGDTSVTMTFDEVCPDVMAPQREHYVFCGYYTEPEGQGVQFYDRADRTTGRSSAYNGKVWQIYDGSVTTLYAHWIPDKAFQYEPNYIPKSPDNDEDSNTAWTEYIMTEGTTWTLADNLFTRNGYRFQGWNTKPDGTGNFYGNRQLVSIDRIEGTVKLYAQWKANTYTVQYAPDAIEENPQIPSPEPGEQWEYDKEYTVSAMPYEKYDRVFYDLNRDKKSTIPSLVASLTEKNTKSIYRFAGWQLYEKKDNGYVKQSGFYTAGQKIKNITAVNGRHYVLFPVWEEIPDGVTLPVAACTGYKFHGWTENCYKDGKFTGSVLTGPYITKRTPLGSYSMITENGYAHKRLEVTLYACWLPKTYDISLDDRGATSMGHTEKVTMTFDGQCPDIMVPTKTGYTFQGYYTGTRGSGKQYYDEEGIGILPWTETEIEVLYAYWIQDAIVFPEEDEYEEPELLPGENMEGQIGRQDAKALLYADDYNEKTGALTDLQPYLVYDTPGTEGVIPGTELLSFRARMGAWMLDYRFHRNSGRDMVKFIVSVPYRTQYELDNEELVISDQQKAVYSFLVPKTWSYWEVVESGMYYPANVTLTNAVLKEQSLTVEVSEGADGTGNIPEYVVKSYGIDKNHVRWPEYEEDGTPVLYLELEQEEYIISNQPNTLPEIKRHLMTVCKNAAWKDEREAEVRSDRYEFDGETVLSDEWQMQNGASLETEKLPKVAEDIAFTSYEQTYRSGIEMDEFKANGLYETFATITYAGDVSNIGVPATKTVEITDINNVNIHTPVACDGVVLDGIIKAEGEKVLVLKEALNFFTLRIDNIGTHRLSLGYGTKEFATALSGKSNVAMESGKLQNQVCFPFDVYVDVGNDSKKAEQSFITEGDYLLTAGTWLTLGEREQQFYVPVTAKNGKYQIKFRSIAVNCPLDRDEKSAEELPAQAYVNSAPSYYVAADVLEFEIKSYLRDFRITATNDPTARERLSQGHQALTLKKGYEFTYEVLSQGEFYAEGTEISIIPRYFWEADDGTGRQEVKLYYAKTLPYGEVKECHALETPALLLQQKNHEVILQRWEGKGMLPADVLCTAKEFPLEEYAADNTITGREEFFFQNGYLILQFDIQVKSNSGIWYPYENWLATRLAADAEQSGWNYVPGDVIRYDLSKSILDDYEVGGAE